MIRKLLAVAGIVGTLGAAAPAFADWYGPGGAVVVAPPDVVAPPAAYVNPYYSPYYANRWRDRDDWRWRDRDDWRWRDRDDWRWRRRGYEWRGHEWREHHHRW